jgi:hypothetical protein
VIDDIGMLRSPPAAAEALSGSSKPPTRRARLGSRATLPLARFNELRRETLAPETVARVLHHAHVRRPTEPTASGSPNKRPPARGVLAHASGTVDTGPLPRVLAEAVVRYAAESLLRRIRSGRRM